MPPPSLDDQLAALYDDESITKLRLLLIVCGGAAACLWHPPHRWATLARQVEELTGLTAERVDELIHLRENLAVARFVGLHAQEFHALLSVGMALLDTPITAAYHAHMRTSPQQGEGAQPWEVSCRMVREIGADLLAMLERIEDGEAGGEAPATEAGEEAETEPETPPATDDEVPSLPHGSDLQLSRLRLEGAITRALEADALPASATEVEAQDLADAPEAQPDEDPAHPDHAHYHHPLLAVEFNEGQLHVLRLGLGIPRTLFAFPELPLGTALRRLTWAGRQAALIRLSERLTRQLPGEPMELSLAETLIFYQAVQVAALGGVRNVVGEINDRLTTLGVERSAEQHNAEQFFAGTTEHSQRVRRLFFESVTAFTGMLREGLADNADDQADLEDAQAEIDALATLL